MSSLNRCTFIGNVGRDPEIKSFNNGGKIANFSIACTESWKDKQSGERKERTEWINISVQNEGLISVVERFVRKGSKLYVEGSFQTRKWQDQNGQDRYSTEVVLRPFNGSIVLLDGKPQQDGGQQREDRTYGQDQRTAGQAHQETRSAFAGGDLDDDVPF